MFTQKKHKIVKGSALHKQNCVCARDILAPLFLMLNESGIRYIVLRNYENLPDCVGDSDLDILVHPDDKVAVISTVNKAMQMAGGVAIGCAHSVGFVKISMFGRNVMKSKSWWGIEIDLFFGVYYIGVAQLVDTNILFNHHHLHNDIRVLPDDLAAVLGVLKELLYNSNIPFRYHRVAAKAIQAKWDFLHANLIPIGEAALELFRELCLLVPDSSDIASKSLELRRAVMQTAFLRSPVTFLCLHFRYEWSKVRRYVKPPGIVVAVLGTDGAGKSTLITTIEPVLSKATHGAFTVKHLRPGLFPPLACLKGERTQQGGPVIDPHGSKPSGKLGSLLRVIYLMVDYALGYWLVVRPRIAKSPTVLLFDRYAYDMMLDPRRFRIALPIKFIRWVTRLAPKPDLILCLHGNPEVLAARKKELPLEEVRRQIGALKVFAATEPRAILVSTEATVEEVRDQILNAIAMHCEKRIRKSLRDE